MMQREWFVRRWRGFALLVPLVGGASALFAAMVQQPAPATPSRPAGAALRVRYTGVNLSGAEFAGNRIPGIAGRDYAYPNAKTAAPFVAAGMTAVRLPFRWERLQPMPMHAFDSQELARLDAAVSALGGFKLIILDPHNYAAYHNIKIGMPETTSAMLADFWTRLAQHYGNRSRIAFGLMNEPSGLPIATWRDAAQESLSAIRRTGARNLVLVPGGNWTGAHGWIKGGATSNAALMASVRDPAGNMAYELHQYVDRNSSGTGSDCVSAEQAAASLAPASDWLREHHARGFLGEFGAPDTPQCLAALGSLLKAMDSSRDVWLGWTYWAGGDRWHNYPMSIQPGLDGPRPQMAVLKPYLAR
uniref:glycoside hydrolase family 5 protein n=1 Tax=uncultured Sphingomonas sp. TaxID=158754 RepID=UPI0035CCA9A3